MKCHLVGQPIGPQFQLQLFEFRDIRLDGFRLFERKQLVPELHLHIYVGKLVLEFVKQDI